MESIKAERITVAMESVREDSVEHLFQPFLMRGLTGPISDGRIARDPIGCRARHSRAPARPPIVPGFAG